MVDWTLRLKGDEVGNFFIVVIIVLRPPDAFPGVLVLDMIRISRDSKIDGGKPTTGRYGVFGLYFVVVFMFGSTFFLGRDGGGGRIMIIDHHPRFAL